MTLIYLIIIIYSVILHELSHGLVAQFFGDDTAQKSGRLTLNPLPHIDPIFTILLPLFFILVGSPFIFGGAKPVPINPKKFKNIKKDFAITAIAGPITNLLIAFVATLLLHFFQINVIAYQMLTFAITINVFLAILNLLPIPPLDGSRVVGGLLPNSLSQKWFSLDRYGLIFIIILFISFNTVLNKVIYPIANYLINILINKL